MDPDASIRKAVEGAPEEKAAPLTKPQCHGCPAAGNTTLCHSCPADAPAPAKPSEFHVRTAAAGA